MIEFKNVSKAFGSKTVLSNVSLTIPKARVTGLIGPNGSGKTTMMRMVATLLRPSIGEVLVDELNTRTESSAVRRKVGLLLGGDTALYDRMSARENVQYFARLQGLDSDVANARIERMADAFNVTSYLDRKVVHFSRGMRQKVSLLRALVHDPDYIILDEPSTGLDIHGIHELQQWVEDCHFRGKTILIASHNISEVERLCEHLILITKDAGVIGCEKEDLVARMDSKSFYEAVFKILDK